MSFFMAVTARRPLTPITSMSTSSVPMPPNSFFPMVHVLMTIPLQRGGGRWSS